MDPRLTQPSLIGPWRPPNPAPEPPAEPPPAHATLADAARAHRDAVDHLAALEQADAKGQRQLWAANDRLEAARDALAIAQERAADATYTRLTGARTPGGPTVAKAEQAVAKAEAEIADLIRARQRIAEERQRIEWSLATRRGDLSRALAATLRESPEMAALADAYLDAVARANAIRAAFKELPLDALPPTVAGYASTNFADRVAFDPALADAWRAALAALELDPAAPLPQPHQELRGTSSSRRGRVKPASVPGSATTPAATDAPLS